MMAPVVSKWIVCKTIQIAIAYSIYTTDGADTNNSYQIKQAEACLLPSELTMEGKIIELKYYPYSMHPLDVAVVTNLNSMKG